MKEKQQGHAILNDVTAPTFDCFLEWACKGFYTPPGPSTDLIREEAEILASTTPANASYEFRSEDIYNRHKKRLGSIVRRGNHVSIEYTDGRIEEHEVTLSHLRKDLRDSFYSRKPDVRGDCNTAPPRKNGKASENYTDIFTCHAQLYVFADVQDIQPLKLLALDELHAVLTVFELYPERTGDIVTLLRYVYGNTVSPSQGEEPLRKVVSDYVGFEMDVLMKDEKFATSMVENGGDMLRDYMSNVSKRIRA